MSRFIEYATRIVQYHEMKDLDKLKALMLEAEGHFLLTKEYDKMIRLYLEVLTDMEYIANMDLIIEYILRFLTFYEELDIKKGRAHYLTVKGYLYFILCDYDKALEVGVEAQIEANKERNPIAMCSTLLNIATLLLKEKQYDQCLEKINEAELLVNEYKVVEWFLYSGLLVAKAECLIMLDKYEEAIELLNKVPKMKGYNESILQRMEYDHVMGIYNYYIGDYESSLAFYKQAISIAEEKNVFFEIQPMYNGIAKVLFKLEYIEESDIYKEKADEITRETNENAAQLLIKKANMTIEADEKIKEAKRRQQNEGLVNTLNLDKFDELTETLNKQYLFDKLNESFIDSKDIELPTCMVLKVENISEVIANSAPIFGDKYIFEIAQFLQKTIDEYVIGRIDEDKFMIVYRNLEPELLKDEVKWLLTNIDQTNITVKGKAYSIDYSYKLYDIGKIKNEKNVIHIDMYNLFE